MLSGLGLLLMFLNTPGLSFLYGTMWALLIVVILQGNTTGTQMSKVVIVQMGQDMEDQARVSGAGWLRTYFRIWIPLLMPTLILLGTLNFVIAANTTSSIILLAARDTVTLSILALEYASVGYRESAGIISILIMVLTLGVALVARAFGPAAEIARQLARIYQVEPGEDIAGRALIFSSAEQAHRRNILPSLTLALNSLPPGGAQRPHKHNSVALALVIQGQDCYSLVDGRQKNWSPWATTITPPGAVHSHHNDGDGQALILIVQDGGLYNHARTMDFAFA